MIKHLVHTLMPGYTLVLRGDRDTKIFLYAHLFAL